MKKASVWIMVCLLAAAGLFPACSDKSDEAKEKNIVEKVSDGASKEIADKILAPVENARDVKELEDKRAEELQKAMDGKE